MSALEKFGDVKYYREQLARERRLVLARRVIVGLLVFAILLILQIATSLPAEQPHAGKPAAAVESKNPPEPQPEHPEWEK